MMNVMRSEETMGVQGGNLGGIPGYPCDNIVQENIFINVIIYFRIDF